MGHYPSEIGIQARQHLAHGNEYNRNGQRRSKEYFAAQLQPFFIHDVQRRAVIDLLWFISSLADRLMNIDQRHDVWQKVNRGFLRSEVGTRPHHAGQLIDCLLDT